MDDLRRSTTEKHFQEELQLQLNKIIEEDTGLENEEKNRLKKLIMEGQFDTVSQILTHRKALATIKNFNQQRSS